MRIRHISVASLIVVLSACAPLSEPGNGGVSVGEGGTVLEPELVLNMPMDQAGCACAEGEATEATLLDRGFTSLVAGRHVEAVTRFKNYRDRRGTPAANWEADIAIAYDSMMPGSPFYDPEAARISYARLAGAQPQAERVHEKVLMMRDALAIFAEMSGRISNLRGDNKELEESLQVREEAISRLRKLTLGQ